MLNKIREAISDNFTEIILFLILGIAAISMIKSAGGDKGTTVTLYQNGWQVAKYQIEPGSLKHTGRGQYTAKTVKGKVVIGLTDDVFFTVEGDEPCEQMSSGVVQDGDTSKANAN